MHSPGSGSLGSHQSTLRLQHRLTVVSCALYAFCVPFITRELLQCNPSRKQLEKQRLKAYENSHSLLHPVWRS